MIFYFFFLGLMFKAPNAPSSTVIFLFFVIVKTIQISCFEFVLHLTEKYVLIFLKQHFSFFFVFAVPQTAWCAKLTD